MMLIRRVLVVGDTGFRVEPEAIDRYGSTVSEHLGRLRQTQSAIGGITVSSEAFGHLPNAQNLAATYQEHASASRRNVQLLAEALANTVGGLRATAQNYATHDQAIGAAFGGGR